MALCLLLFKMLIKLKLLILLFSVSCFSAVGEQSFTPSSAQFWVEKIVLSSGMSSLGVPNGDQLILHQCQSSDCYLTVSDNDLLSQLSGNKQIKAGAYRYLTVTTCSGNETFFLGKLKGSVQIDAKITIPIQVVIELVDEGARSRMSYSMYILL